MVIKLFKDCSDGVHRYKAVYDSIPPDKLSMSAFEGDLYTWKKIAEAFTSHIYVKHVCTKCGKTINREEKP